MFISPPSLCPEAFHCPAYFVAKSSEVNQKDECNYILPVVVMGGGLGLGGGVGGCQSLSLNRTKI